MSLLSVLYLCFIKVSVLVGFLEMSFAFWAQQSGRERVVSEPIASSPSHLGLEGTASQEAPGMEGEAALESVQSTYTKNYTLALKRKRQVK